MLDLRVKRAAAAAALLLAAASLAGSGAAQDSLGPPVGTIQIESRSLAAGIGISWGNGVLVLDDKAYPFSVSGLSVADVGFAKLTATGEVFQLTELSQLNGTYYGVNVGIAVGGGTAGLALRNEHGVQLRLRATQRGLKLSFASKGMTLKLQ